MLSSSVQLDFITQVIVVQRVATQDVLIFYYFALFIRQKDRCCERTTKTANSFQVSKIGARSATWPRNSADESAITQNERLGPRPF